MAIAGDHYAMPSPFQKKADRHLDGRVVIDDQDFRQDPSPNPAGIINGRLQE